MCLDIVLFRDPAGANLIRESQRRRFRDPKTVDAVIEADERWRKAQYLAEVSRRLVNDCSKAVGDKKKKKEADGPADAVPPAEFIASATQGTLTAAKLPELCVNQIKGLSRFLSERLPVIEKEAIEAATTRDDLLHEIGNIVHEDIPVTNDEDLNGIVRTFGTCVAKPKNHVDIMTKLGCMDTGKAVTAMAGGRAYVLKGGLVQLHMALSMYATSFLVSKGYIPFYPPVFLTKTAMAEVAQLSQFDDELYKVTGEGEDKYLIATSEQSIAAYQRGRVYSEADLAQPIKYAGVSSCFRKEVGSHGRDTLGIFRVHQFDKIEQFIVCNPKNGESWKMQEEMIAVSEDFYKSLNIPYRVVNICTGALNNAAAKKYDLEGWFPGSSTYRELVSCSNCTDYQSRRLNCRLGTAATAVKEYPHMLNSTLCAITRTLCAICENYQTEEGVIIPEVLRPFMMGQAILRYETKEEVAAATAPAAKAEAPKA